MKKRIIPLLIFPAIIISGCHEKELDYLPKVAYNVEVLFDWQKAPEHRAKSMSLYLYPENHEYDYFTFPNVTGGPIQAGVGNSTAICLNEDDIYGIQIRNHQQHDTFEVTTGEARSLQVLGISTRGIPRTDDQELRDTPVQFWGTHNRDITIYNTQEKQTIILYPEELVCHYTVDILEVENLMNADQKIDAALSSLAGGMLPGKLMTTEESISHIFSMSANSARNKLSSSFFTFGVPAGDVQPHYLTLYFKLRDGTGKTYNFDVTEQVNDAPDPKNVHIVIRGLKLPDIDPDMGNVGVAVNGWESIYIAITPPSLI